MNIRANDRVLFVGATGSGKTSVAKSLLWGIKNVYVLDPKRTFDLPDHWPNGWVRHETLSPVESHEDSSTVIYRPTYEDQEKYCEDFFQFVFERGNCVVYVDEAMAITNETRIAKWYKRCMTEGRERGLGTWNSTQRPTGIPRILITEAQHFFTFRLKAIGDRQRMAKESNEPKLGQYVKDQNGYFYYNERTQQAKYFKKADIGKVLSP